jgi:hypothetical protein
MEMLERGIPRIERTKNGARLIVDGKPFIVLGGEIHNSSSSSLEYMEDIWRKLVSLNCNTAIVPITWELIEPEEGKFDFTLLEGLVEKAREYGLHLVILWFGTWKNALSSYVPKYVKTDLKRFPRAQLKDGRKTTTISPLSANARDADARAFEALMGHIRKIDEDKNTIIMVQVENEAGLLGAARDYSPMAEKHFNSEVPKELIDYLNIHENELIGDVKKLWRSSERKVGSWLEVFGNIAEEVFMSWHIGSYINKVSGAGRNKYNLPMFVNAWIVQYKGEQPGMYPSGGPVSRMINIWHCAAPNIDLIAPDIYLHEFPEVCASYKQGGNPLFIPEARRDRCAPGNVFYAVGQHEALCFAPFGIESIDFKEGPLISNIVPDALFYMDSSDVGFILAKSYKVISNITPVITKHYGTGNMIGILQSQLEVYLTELGQYKLKIKYKAPLKYTKFPGAAIIIAISPTEYLIAGFGFSVEFLPKAGDKQNIDFISIEEGTYVDEEWHRTRRLNGDEYGVILGEDPIIIRVELYSFE